MLLQRLIETDCRIVIDTEYPLYVWILFYKRIKIPPEYLDSVPSM